MTTIATSVATTKIKPLPLHDPEHERQYANFMQRMTARLQAAGQHLFTVDSSDLWDRYLSGFPEAERQYHNCNTCRRFIQQYGGLMRIDDQGFVSHAFFSVQEAPEEYKRSIENILVTTHNKPITGVYLEQHGNWGVPSNVAHYPGGDYVWTHFHLRPASRQLYSNPVWTPYQRMAVVKENHRLVQAALREYDLDLLTRALHIVQADGLYRGNVVLAQVEWLVKLKQQLAKKTYAHQQNNGRGDAYLWLQVAGAPDGFCHPRSGMLGTLLEDIMAGLSLEQVAQRFREKMNPTQYLRPQAAPSAGTIKQAEEIIQKLNAEGSLKRRLACMADMQTIWHSRYLVDATPAPAVTTGVFRHLTPKEKVARPTAPIFGAQIPSQTMTFVKLRDTVLPTAEAIEYWVPSGMGTYTGFITALDPAAPPILRWDTVEQRNPVSWYMWSGGSPSEQFGLKAHTYHPVVGVSLCPAHWNGARSSDKPAACFLLEGTRDKKADKAGLGLFPEILKAEFHSIRSVIEAFSKAGVADPAPEDKPITGVTFQSNMKLRVYRNQTWFEYILDRWD